VIASIKLGRTTAISNALSPIGSIVFLHDQFCFSMRMKKFIIKVKRNTLMPVIPKNAKNLNLYILLTNINGNKQIAVISIINY
jgi:hypothetical protein